MSVTVGIRKFRENLSHYVDLVKSGEEIVITDRGTRVARLVAPARLDQLVNEGRVRPATKPKKPIRTEDLIQIDGPPWPSEMIIADRKR